MFISSWVLNFTNLVQYVSGNEPNSQKAELLVELHFQKNSWKNTLLLAYQSLGVVYGDLSISPLYVYKSAFAEDIQHSDTNEEIYGVLSFVFWTLTLVPLVKYVFIVLRADDNGEGKYLQTSEKMLALSSLKSQVLTFD